MTDIKSAHDAAIQAFHREIESAVQRLAAESERLTGEKFDWNWWNNGLPELIDDSLRDASIKLDMDAADTFAAEFEELSDRNTHHASVL